MFTCGKCKKSFETKKDYDRHVNKKMDCLLNNLQILQYKPHDIIERCPYCLKYFDKSGDIQRHLQSKKNSCYISRLENSQNRKTVIDKLIIENTNNNNKIKNLNVNSNFKPIKFRKRGKERVDHITKDVVLELFKNQKFIWICEELMKLIYFNEKVPENSSWSIAYPKNDTAGVAYNEEDDEFERKATKEIVEDKFSNMINLLVPVMQSIHKDTEFYQTLSDMQQINIVRFFYHLGMYQISKESPDVYEAMHRLCYEQRKIPMKLWGEHGYSGKHLSLKFG